MLIWSLVLPGALPAYYVVLMLNFFRQIPIELEEAATIDGASRRDQFTRITFPLIRNTLVSSITIWTTRVCAFFALSRVFAAAKTVSPLMYIYDVLFGSESGNTAVGVGAAGAVVLTCIVVFVFVTSNLIPRNKDIEL